MDRKKAQSYIGAFVLLDEYDNGKYIAVLEDVITEPNAPWRGNVKIRGVYTYPSLTTSSGFQKLIYRENEQSEVPGKRIEPFNEEFTASFDESHARALKERWEEYHLHNEEVEKTLVYIQQELRKLRYEHLIFEDAYVYYQLVKKGRKAYIYDGIKRESLSLEGCPFEFEVLYENEWKTSFYQSGLTFITHEGNHLHLKHGDTIRLNKAQFDPYKILMHELEEPSLHALERGLSKLGIGHEHSVYCHNSLLMKLLNSHQSEEMNGVNFISYASDKQQYVVQHHYERKLIEDAPHETYDRFEFTADNGERVITTYATQLSNDS